jgi:hypothetical protein
MCVDVFDVHVIFFLFAVAEPGSVSSPLLAESLRRCALAPRPSKPLKPLLLLQSKVGLSGRVMSIE